MNLLVFFLVAVGAGTCIATVGLAVVGVLATRKEERRRKAFEARPRARIGRVGSVVLLPDGRRAISNWEFDCLNRIPPFDLREGVVLYAGYTVDELEEIAARRAEWEP